MKFYVPLGMFYSNGDEDRFFQGLKHISAVKEICGIGRGLQIKLDLRYRSQRFNAGIDRSVLAL